MRQLRFLTAYLFSILTLLGCRNNIDLTGKWKPTEVKIWDNYHQDSLVINLVARQFHFNQLDKEIEERLTPSHRDSLLKLLSVSHLILKKDSTFEVKDHGFFTQAIYDSNWQSLKVGKWSINMSDSTLKLLQSNGIYKCYKLLNFGGDSMSIGELFECYPEPPMTVINLIR